MEQVFEQVRGLNVHKATIAPCVRVPDTKGKRVQYPQTFGTMTADSWRSAIGSTLTE